MKKESNKVYKTIGEVAKILNLVDKKTGKVLTHTFSGKRRYYDNNTIEILKKIQFLLKNEGLTLKGVKKKLKEDDSYLDDHDNKTINKRIIKTKINKISKLLKNIKNYG